MRKVTVTLGAVLLLAIGAVAYAAIPDAQGVIHGCYKLSNPAKGSVLVVDSEVGGTCPSGFAELNWNQTGPQGPQGPAAPTPVARTITSDMVVSANGPVASRSLSCANDETAFSPVAVQYDASGQFLQGFGLEWVAQPDFGTGQPIGTAGPRGYFIQAKPGPADGLMRFHITCVTGITR